MRAVWTLAKQYGRPYWGVILGGLVASSATAGLNGLALKRLQPVFEAMFVALEKAHTVGAHEQLQKLWHASLVLFAAFMAASVGAAVSSYAMAWAGQHIVKDLRRELFERLEMMSLRFFEVRPVGELISRVSNDTSVLMRTVSGDLADLVMAPLSALVLAVLMVQISWRLALLTLVGVPVVLVITRLLGHGVRLHARRAQERMAALTARLNEAFTGIRVVKTLGLERIMAQRFLTENLGVVREQLRVARLRCSAEPLAGFLGGAGVVATLLLGGREIILGRLTAAALMTFLILALRAGAFVSKFSLQLLAIHQAEGAAQRVLELLATEVEPPDPPDALELEEVRGELEFDHVTFAYDPERPVLDGFSLRIGAGEHVAIVGPSGAGKTTVANLAARAYDPDAGQVRVDGHDLRKIKRACYRRLVALVPQDTVIFAATVRENIAFGRPGASEEEIIAAARAAQAHEFIQALPQGYDTPLTDLGQNLSSGQRQRLAVARALLRQPRILILDEATSALDRENEAALLGAVEKLMAGRTVITIAHRLAAVQDADRIVVMLDGRVVEQGTHEELLRAGGVYHRLYYAQAEAEPAPVNRAEG
jgi:subfamily B ATP-binding cassette protein MsbA